MVSDMEGLMEFFDAEASVGVLLAVDPIDGTLTKDIKKKIPASPNTVTERISEAEALGLLRTPGAVAGDHGNAKRYYLTGDGRVCLVAIVSLNLDELVKAHYEIMQQLESQYSILVDWVGKEASLFLDDKKPDVPKDGISDQFKLGGAYPGDDLPPDYEDFIYEDETEMDSFNPSADVIDYERLE